MWQLVFHYQTLLNNFVIRMQKFQTVTLLYLTVPVYLQLWLWIEMPMPKSVEVGSLSKYERQKLQKLYKQGGATIGSVRILVKTSKLPVSKVRQFLNSKHSYKKFILATRKIKRTKAFASFNIEVWCMDLAYVEKLVNANSGVKHRSSGPVWWNRICKRNENKRFQRNCSCNFDMFTEKNRLANLWIDKGTESAKDFKNFAKLKEHKFTLQGVRPGLQLLRLHVQDGPSKIYFLPLHGRKWIQVHW